MQTVMTDKAHMVSPFCILVPILHFAFYQDLRNYLAKHDAHMIFLLRHILDYKIAFFFTMRLHLPPSAMLTQHILNACCIKKWRVEANKCCILYFLKARSKSYNCKSMVCCKREKQYKPETSGDTLLLSMRQSMMFSWSEKSPESSFIIESNHCVSQAMVIS